MSESEMHDAQLFWDDQDAATAGWILRFYEKRVDTMDVEVVVEIGETEDASVETLAHQVADCVPAGATGKIRVFRGDAPRGAITLVDGQIADWRAS